MQENLTVVRRSPVIVAPRPIVYSPTPVIYSSPGVVYYDGYHRVMSIGVLIFFIVLIIILSFSYSPVIYV